MAAPLAEALTLRGLRSDFEISGPAVRTIARIVDGRRITFVANPSGEAVRVRISVPQHVGALSAWDPVELRTFPLPAGGLDDGRTVVESTLPAFGSLFIVHLHLGVI